MKGINLIKRYLEIKRIKKDYRIDTTISFMYGPNLLNILTKKDDKIILSIRANTATKSKTIYDKLNKLSIKKMYDKADYITTVSNGIRYDLINNYSINQDKVKVIYNFFELDIIKKSSEDEIDIEHKHIFNNDVIITCGRLEKVKAFHHLIRAFQLVVKRNKSAKLVILGEGSLKGYLQSLIVNLNLGNNVFLLGFQSNPFKYIKNSTIFILPSISEGFPNVLVEAMSCGLPVIASDCKTGPREILAPHRDINNISSNIEYAEYGVLIPVCDGKKYNYNDELTREERIMADSIAELLNNRFLRKNYAQKALKRANDFDVNVLIKNWEEIID